MNAEQLAGEIEFLARSAMPRMAAERRWPVHLDHCFKRVLMDNAVGCCWRDVVPAPFAQNATEQQLRRVVELAMDVIDGKLCLWELNNRSLAWRGKKLRAIPEQSHLHSEVA